MIDGPYPRLNVGAHQIEYRRLAGDPQKPTLVLLHEGLGCVALWRDFPERLAARTGCPVFVYSRFGYGGSSSRALPWPLDYMEQEGGHGLPQVLAAAEISRCVLIGHSDGASIALVAAGSHAVSGLVGLVVLAPHVFAEALGLASIRKARTAFIDGNLRDRLARYHGANVEGAFYGWCDAWLHPDFVRWNLEPYLPGIRVPLLQLQGDADQYGTRAQLQAIERQVSGPVQTQVLPCQHAPQFELPAESLALMADFVAALM